MGKKPETPVEVAYEFEPPSRKKVGMVEICVSAHTRIVTTLGPAQWSKTDG